MSRSHAALGAIAVAATVAAAVFAGLYFTKGSGSESAAQECGDRIYGHISSLTPKAGQYELRFDPAWFTSGVTANAAAAEDGVVEPNGAPAPDQPEAGGAPAPEGAEAEHAQTTEPAATSGEER